jgi:hypothetical protein
MSKTQSFVNTAHAWVIKNPWKTGSLIFALLALWFAIHGADLFQQNKTERDALALRDATIKKLQPYSASLIEKMQASASQFTSTNSLSDLDAVKSVFANSMNNAELVQLHNVSLCQYRKVWRRKARGAGVCVK